MFTFLIEIILGIYFLIKIAWNLTEKNEFYQLVSQEDEVRSFIQILLDHNSTQQLEILKKVKPISIELRF